MGQSSMKAQITSTMKSYYESKIIQHKLNIDVMMNNPIAIPEHENFVSAIDKELSELADAHDKLQALKEYF